MFGYQRNPAQAYAQVGLESGAIAASPHKLIVMLFDGALTAITVAKHHMEAGQVIEKGEAINKASSIITAGLQASLNLEVGGEMAKNLYALYDYMARRLTQAHAQNSTTMLQEVYDLLNEIKTAWDGINPQKVAAVSAKTK